MDIAKIRKKLKQGGGSKKRKDDGQDKAPEPSALPDALSSKAGNADGQKNAQVKIAGTEGSPLSEEVSFVPQSSDDDTEDTEDIVPTLELLSFRVSGKTYAFRVEDVQEILRKQQVTPVPGTAPFLTGITSLRGTMIPVMDLSCRLVMDMTHDYGKRSKILVVYGPKGSIGVLLESALAVLTVPVSSVDGAPKNLSEDETRFISGVIQDGERLVFIIDVEELFDFSGKVEAR